MSIENKIQLLWNSATTLKGDTQTHKLLKSIYINTCRNIARNSIQIPKEKFAISQMCPYCGCFWIESEFSLKLKSQQIVNNAKTSKIMEKLYKSKDDANKGFLNKKQRNRAIWIKKRVTNYLEMNCHQCKHKSLVKMENSKNKLKKTTDEKLMKGGGINVDKNNTKPRKKNKCKTEGLQHPQEKRTNLAEHKNIKSNISTFTTKQKKNHPNSHLDRVTETPQRKHQTSTLLKKKAVVFPSTANSNKLISKTQKQNSLLQLAVLLKNQSSDAKNPTQKRLESLLK